jgi:hypothetical protein
MEMAPAQELGLVSMELDVEGPKNDGEAERAAAQTPQQKSNTSIWDKFSRAGSRAASTVSQVAATAAVGGAQAFAAAAQNMAKSTGGAVVATRKKSGTKTGPLLAGLWNPGAKRSSVANVATVQRKRTRRGPGPAETTADQENAGLMVAAELNQGAKPQQAKKQTEASRQKTDSECANTNIKFHFTKWDVFDTHQKPDPKTGLTMLQRILSDRAKQGTNQHVPMGAAYWEELFLT